MDPMPNISESDIPQVNVSPSVPVKHGNPLLKILIGLVLLGIGVGIGWLLANNKNISLSPKQTISTYDDCLDAKGSVIQESYPATCVTSDGTRFTQPLTEEEQQNLQPPDLDNEQIDLLDDANWKTYTNTKYGYSFQYPPELTIFGSGYNPPEVSQAFGISLQQKEQGYNKPLLKIDVQTSKTSRYPTGSIKEYIDASYQENTAHPETFIRTIMPITPTTFAELKAYEYEIESKGFNSVTEGFLGEQGRIKIIVFQKDNYFYLIGLYNIPPFDQILSTFKFLDKVSDTTPTSQPIIIKISGIMPTTDWKLVSNDGVVFRIPSYASCNVDTKCSYVSYPNYHNGVLSPVPSRISVSVSTYLGGSRRQQYLDEHKGVADCKPIYKDTLFGVVSALQIAIDGGWCQGGYAGGIVSVVGNKLVVIGPGLTYNENKEISRWDVRDTLVSTLSSQ